MYNSFTWSLGQDRLYNVHNHGSPPTGDPTIPTPFFGYMDVVDILLRLRVRAFPYVYSHGCQSCGGRPGMLRRINQCPLSPTSG